MRFQRTAYNDLMCMKIKNLGWKESHGIQTTNVEDSQGNIIVDYRQVRYRKFREPYYKVM
jgi:hypothetical protein